MGAHDTTVPPLGAPVDARSDPLAQPNAERRCRAWQALLVRAHAEAGACYTEAAESCGVERSSYTRRLVEPGRCLRVSDVPALPPDLRDYVLAALELACGRVSQPAPGGARAPVATDLAAREARHGETAAAALAALADGHVDEVEARRLLARLDAELAPTMSARAKLVDIAEGRRGSGSAVEDAARAARGGRHDG